MFCEFGNELERDRENIKGLRSFFNRVLLQCGKSIIFYFVLLILKTFEISPYIFHCYRKNLTLNKSKHVSCLCTLTSKNNCVVRKVEYSYDVFKCLVLIANRRQMERSAKMTFIPTLTSIQHVTLRYVTFIRTRMKRKFHKQ